MNQEVIGKKIKEIRINNNLTQQEFANKLNVTYQAVSKWENGKNLPDITTLTNICKTFNVDIDTLLIDKEKKKFNKKYLLLIIPIVLIILLVIALICNKDNFNFSSLTTTCKEFNISGVVAYNKDKTSIYVSNISYCGKESDLIFKEIACTLYEEVDNKRVKINDCKSVDTLTNLKDYLEDLTINIEHVSNYCKDFKENNLYLEINGKNDDEKIITYKIPLTIDSNC